MEISFNRFPTALRDEIIDYIDDVGADWEPEGSRWLLQTVPLQELTKAEWRMLPSLDAVDLSMAEDGTRTPNAPIVLDADFSVIDGMHRLAKAIKAGKNSLQAYVRVEDEDAV